MYKGKLNMSGYPLTPALKKKLIDKINNEGMDLIRYMGRGKPITVGKVKKIVFNNKKNTNTIFIEFDRDRKPYLPSFDLHYDIFTNVLTYVRYC